MQLFCFVIGLICFFTLASSAPLISDFPLALRDVTHYGMIGGFNVSLGGTNEDMIAKIKALDPSLNFAASTLGRRNENTLQVLQPRQGDPKVKPRGLFCYPIAHQDQFYPASIFEIAADEGHLSYISTIWSSPGCGRIACSGKGAITLCNDRSYSIPIQGIALAYHIDRILDACSSSHGHGPESCGQSFDDDGYNVIAHWESC